MDIINTDIYDMRDAATRAHHIEAARLQLEGTGSAVIPNFVNAAALTSMVEEAKAGFEHAHRREMELGFNPKDELLLGDPVLLGRRSPFRMSSLGSDLLAEGKPLKRLYRSKDLIEFIREIVGEESLHCTTDPLINATVTYMGDGDQQGWHFDDNDFVVSLLLQGPESGGNFEYVPNATTLPLSEIDKILDGESTLTQRLVPQPGTLLLFRGRKALHRVAPVSGSRLRIIVLLSYDRSPDFVYPDQVRLNALGRTSPILP